MFVPLVFQVRLKQEILYPSFGTVQYSTWHDVSLRSFSNKLSFVYWRPFGILAEPPPGRLQRPRTLGSCGNMTAMPRGVGIGNVSAIDDVRSYVSTFSVSPLGCI